MTGEQDDWLTDWLAATAVRKKTERLFLFSNCVKGFARSFGIEIVFHFKIARMLQPLLHKYKSYKVTL